MKYLFNKGLEFVKDAYQVWNGLPLAGKVALISGGLGALLPVNQSFGYDYNSTYCKGGDLFIAKDGDVTIIEQGLCERLGLEDSQKVPKSYFDRRESGKIIIRGKFGGDEYLEGSLPVGPGNNESFKQKESDGSYRDLSHLPF